MRFRTLLFACLICSAASTTVVAQSPSTTQSVVLSSEEEGPVVLFNGKEISQGELAKMDVENIGDITIMTGEQAKAKYGKYETHGVIVMTSADQSPAVQETVTTGTVAAGAPSEPVAEEVQMSFSPDINYHVIMDGKVSSMDALNALSPDQIDQIQIHRATEAMELFGDVAKEGAIVVTTK